MCASQCRMGLARRPPAPQTWLKSGLYWSMLAKCAAWPPSWSSVMSAVLPLPTALGVASEVKLARLGTQVPSACRQATAGQWQKPVGAQKGTAGCNLS